jgi:hypothetical protein
MHEDQGSGRLGRTTPAHPKLAEVDSQIDDFGSDLHTAADERHFIPLVRILSW